ncbi:MAG: hypothetical protein AAF363_03375 [Bacteroidota bacterium]
MLSSTWDYLFETNKILAYGSLIFLLLTIITLILIPLESRLVLGINLWIKPLKFSFSILIFLLTSLWMMEVIGYQGLKKDILSWVLVATMLFEIFCIIFQAGRGQLSHFNVTDPIGSVMFPLMAWAITIAYLVYALILIDSFRYPLSVSPSMLWAIRLGILVFLFGLISGFMMGGRLQHTVGVPDGGPSLPFTNWSTVAGDLRVSHFLSIHAIQVLPIVALALTYLPKPVQSNSLIIILSTGGFYFLFTIATLVQAILGKPFIRL